VTATAEPTPQPFYLQGPAADVPPEVMAFHERSQLRAAAFYATRVYPGPVGELVSRELLAWEDFGKRLGGHGPIERLAKFVLAQPVQTEA
jgi:hypothetical protein